MKMENGMDLTGLLVIKARLGEDVRKVPISNLEIRKDELLLMMQRIFKGSISAQDTVLLKYSDEDGDLVTINDDSDLSFAIQCFKVLKITLFVNDMQQSLEHSEVKHIRSELQKIRDTTNNLLDRLDMSQVNKVNSSAESDIVREPSPVPNRRPMLETSREFDPLSYKSPPIDDIRPAPPMPVQMPISSPEKPPSVYGMGFQEPNQNSRPDTPSSQSRQSDSTEHVATIQPSMHQQVNAGHPNHTLMNGPAPPSAPPTSMYQPPTPQPPQPQPPQPQAPQPQHNVQQQQYAPQPPQQPAPPTFAQQGGFGGQAQTQHSQATPPPPPMPAQAQPQQQHYQQMQQPQPHAPMPPVVSSAGSMYPVPPGGPAQHQYQQYSQQQHWAAPAPPSNYGHPAPPASAPYNAGPGGPPPMGPPPVGGAAGPNPFARGGFPPTSAPYARPAYPNPTFQM